MQIDEKMLGLRFLETEMTSADITDALNIIQEAYDRYMRPAWEATKGQDPGAGGHMVAKRGLSFAVAVGSFHMFLTHGAPKQLEEMIAEAIGETVPQMVEQVKRQRLEKADQKKEPSA